MKQSQNNTDKKQNREKDPNRSAVSNSRFNLIKTIQLVIFIALTIAALTVLFRDKELYLLMGSNHHIRLLGFLLWLLLGISFVFLYYDFYSYTGLKRENTELDNAIFSDALTGVANRYSVDVYIGQFLNQPLPADMGCVTFDLTNLGEINAVKGHGGGDAAIQEFSDVLKEAAEGACFIGRNGGNKFLAILRDCSRNRLDSFLQAVEEQLNDRNAQHPEVKIAYSAGTAFQEGDQIHTLTELVALSDRRAYQAAWENRNPNPVAEEQTQE